MKSTVLEVMNKRIKIQNPATFYHLSKVFKVISLCKTNFSYLEWCFILIVETKIFSELDKSCVSRTLGSLSLQTDSEVEVYDAENKRLSYNIDERNKFTKQLLLKVRLNQRSDLFLKTFFKRTLKYL